VDAPGTPTGDFSWMVWARPTSVAGWRALLEIQTATSTGIELALDEGRPQVWSNGLLRLTATASLPVNAWSHVALTRAGSTLTAYVNGAAVATAVDPTAFTWGSCPFLIGVDADSGCTGLLNGYFSGQLDEVRVYSRALSATEIAAAMNAPLVSVPPTISINDVTVTEGNTGSVSAVFTVSLSAASAQQVTVQYTTADSTATAGSDYTATSGTLTFTPGQLTRTIAVVVLGDTTFEPDETFLVNLTSPVNATIARGQGVGTITNDDAPPPPTLSINDVTVTEGNTGSVNAVFMVTLSAASTQQVTVQYATANGTATAGIDYTATSGTLTFAAGQTSRTITVPVLGDSVAEGTETFVVNLSNPVNATIADGQGQGTILDDDGGPAGLVLAFGFEEGTGTTTADVSGNAHPGTLVGTTWATTGKYGRAVVLNGSTQYVRVDAPSAPTGDFSWMVWANPTTLSGWRGLLEIQTSGSAGVELALDAGRPQVWSNGQLRLTATGVLAVNTWTHMAITRAGSTLTVYVNGVSVGTATETAAFSWSTCPFLIGVDADSGCTGLLNGQFAGQLDEFRLYNRALSPTEIQAAMNAPLPAP
jgi:hypothetical protein